MHKFAVKNLYNLPIDKNAAQGEPCSRRQQVLCNTCYVIGVIKKAPMVGALRKRETKQSIFNAFDGTRTHVPMIKSHVRYHYATNACSGYLYPYGLLDPRIRDLPIREDYISANHAETAVVGSCLEKGIAFPLGNKLYSCVRALFSGDVLHSFYRSFGGLGFVRFKV